jgi:hypothetical protein
MTSKRYFIRPTGKGETLYNVFDGESPYSSNRAVPVVEFVAKAEAEKQRDRLNAKHEYRLAEKDKRFRRTMAFSDSLSEVERTKRSEAQKIAAWENKLLPSSAEHFLSGLHGILVALRWHSSAFEYLDKGLRENLADSEVKDKGTVCFQAAFDACREVKSLQQQLGLDMLLSDAKRVLDNQQVTDTMKKDFMAKYGEEPAAVVAEYEARSQAFYETYDQEHPTDS